MGPEKCHVYAAALPSIKLDNYNGSNIEFENSLRNFWDMGWDEGCFAEYRQGRIIYVNQDNYAFALSELVFTNEVSLDSDLVHDNILNDFYLQKSQTLKASSIIMVVNLPEKSLQLREDAITIFQDFESKAGKYNINVMDLIGLNNSTSVSYKYPGLKAQDFRS